MGIGRLLAGLLLSEGWQRFRRRRHGLARRLLGRAPTVHYFHQVDDPYSHMAAQRLEALRLRYKVRFRHHLVAAPPPEYQGDAVRFPLWGLLDARSVAPFYGVSLPSGVDQPDAAEVRRAEAQLATARGSPAFAALALRLGDKLWRGPADGPEPAQQGTQQDLGQAAGKAQAALRQGMAMRARLGHYLSASFYFEGEWYWGLDRLCHLETRLTEKGLSRQPEAPLCVARPDAEPATGKGAGLTLEYFPSLRSPYTAIVHARVLELVERSGVALQMKPVMPMVMRGVPVPRHKRLYIMMDAAREGRAAGVPFGKVVDPLGRPVKRAFSLLPYFQGLGLDAAFVAEYLRAAWQEGLDITTDAGLQAVVARAGGNWQEAEKQLGSKGYKALLKANLEEMLAAGLWGVPSFRVTGGKGAGPFQCWGQDRLWRVETEIARRAA